MSEDDRIAVVGLACRVPGADDPVTLWRNLLAGTVDSVRRLTAADGRAHRPRLGAGVRPARRPGGVRRGPVRLPGRGGGAARPAAPAVPGGGLARAGRRRHRPRPRPGPDRRVRRLRPQPLPASPPAGQPGPAARRRGPGRGLGRRADRRGRRLPADPCRVRAGPDRAGGGRSGPPARPRWSRSARPRRACWTTAATWWSPVGRRWCRPGRPATACGRAAYWPPTGCAAPTTRRPPGRCSATARARWCSNGSPTRVPTATTCTPSWPGGR